MQSWVALGTYWAVLTRLPQNALSFYAPQMSQIVYDQPPHQLPPMKPHINVYQWTMRDTSGADGYIENE